MNGVAETLEAVLTEVTPKRGGMDHGEKWHGSLDEKCSWGAKANENLMEKQRLCLMHPWTLYWRRAMRGGRANAATTLHVKEWVPKP